MGRTQGAFDAELMAIRMGVRSLVARYTGGKDYTVFTDSQAAMAREIPPCQRAWRISVELARSAPQPIGIRESGKWVDRVVYTPDPCRRRQAQHTTH